MKIRVSTACCSTEIKQQMFSHIDYSLRKIGNLKVSRRIFTQNIGEALGMEKHRSFRPGGRNVKTH